MKSHARLLTSLAIALLIAVLAFYAGYQQRVQVEIAEQDNFIHGPARIPLGAALEGPSTHPPQLPGAPAK